VIASYKFYQGVVLCELVDLAGEAITIDELKEDGRLSSYILNNRAGLHIKHSTARMTPWGFTISRDNVEEFFELRQRYNEVFIALVCHTDGIVTLTLKELVSLITEGIAGQAWVRVERRPNKQYTIVGNKSSLAYKKKRGLSDIINYLSGHTNGAATHCTPVLSHDASAFQVTESLRQ
jgi:hypothetical protein